MADVDDRRAVPFERGGLQHRLIRVRVDLAQRGLRIKPLRVLLEPIKDERSAYEPLIDQRFCVLHPWAVTKGEAELCLEPFAARQRRCTTGLTEVVGHGLLTQHMLAGFERGPRQLEMRVGRGHDIDHVDVRPAHDSLPVIGCLGNRELAGTGARAFPFDVTQCDDRAPRVAQPARNVSEPGPGACAQDRDSDLIHAFSLPFSLSTDR